ncbi:transglutaminase family protein [Neogemmobacter tilapiae]|uniref:Transglutaminase n=1 Tax=Neogemmobacter tilapiae TaxID=875041 RepID=A0A918WIN6_9RHOB|nr:transglutaminase family protein [Gemmobacter tilapiae]GHC49805.1 transglutaminase [Gemmobacter tilapiae]
MLLQVNHVTRYVYDRPVRGVVQSHRLTPSVFAGQKVIDWQVTVSDGQKGGSFRDGAGDRIESWSIRGPVSEILVTVTGRVETTDLVGVLKGHKETTPPQSYLRSTAPTEADVALTELAQVGEGEPLAVAHRMAEAVAGAIAYAPGTTHAHTTAAEALAQGQGVCQDHAHALIAMARARGIPARYVSGYLFADAEGQAHEAAHAWAELHVQGYGWVGFDPANRCCPDDRYIRLGSGLDAQNAAPIRGISRGIAEEAMDVTVAVLAAQQ